MYAPGSCTGSSGRFLSPKSHLPALTGLRFVAASAIVVFHISYGNIFRLPIPLFGNNETILLAQGVSIFFVLSGLILTYVYPKLKTGAAVCHFLVSRIARIWPAHIAAIALLLAILGFAGSGLTAEEGTLKLLVDAAMLHAWIPTPGYYFC